MDQPVEQHSERGSAWRRVALVALAILAMAMALIVLLVLTGIIAEPETVIEAIVRTLLGR